MRHVIAFTLPVLVALPTFFTPACTSESAVERTAQSDQAIVLPGGGTPPIILADPCDNDNLCDHHGPTIRNARIVNVNWGSNIDPALQAMLPLFYADLVGGYLTNLSEYGIGAGSYGGSFTIQPTDPRIVAGGPIDRGDIGAELVRQIQAGNLPGDSAGTLQTIYVVHFPRGAYVVDIAGLPPFYDTKYLCIDGNGGYHAYSNGVVFAAIPDQASCGGSVAQYGAFNVTTRGISHEIEEAVTDLDSGSHAWRDSSDQEVGDKCRQYHNYPGPSGVEWYVNGQWLNSKGGCSANPVLNAAANTSGSGVVARAGNLDLITADATGQPFASDHGTYSSWQANFLGGPSMTRPFSPMALTTRTPANMEGFFFDNHGTLQMAAYQSGQWSPAQSLTWAPAGAPAGQVSAIARSTTNLDIFYVASDGSIQSGAWWGSGWTSETVQGAGASQPGWTVAAVASQANQIDAFWVTSAGVMTSRGQGYGSAWSKATPVSQSYTLGALRGGLAAVVDSTSAEEVFYPRNDGNIGVSMPGPNPGQWIDSWQIVPGTTVPAGAQIAALMLPGNVAHAFFAASDRNIWDFKVVRTVSGSIVNMGFSVTRVTNSGNVIPGSWVGAVASSPSEIDLFFFDANGNLVWEASVGDAWLASPIPRASPVTPTNCIATLHCQNEVTYTCDQTPNVLYLQIGDGGNPEAWSSIGSYGSASISPEQAGADLRVCASSAGEFACTGPIPYGPPAYDTGCSPPASGGGGGAGGGGGGGGGGKRCNLDDDPCCGLPKGAKCM